MFSLDARQDLRRCIAQHACHLQGPIKNSLVDLGAVEAHILGNQALEKILLGCCDLLALNALDLLCEHQKGVRIASLSRLVVDREDLQGHADAIGRGQCPDSDSQGHLMKLLDLLQIRVQACPAHSNVPGIELRVLVQKRQLGW